MITENRLGAGNLQVGARSRDESLCRHKILWSTEWFQGQVYWDVEVTVPRRRGGSCRTKDPTLDEERRGRYRNSSAHWSSRANGYARG